MSVTAYANEYANEIELTEAIGRAPERSVLLHLDAQSVGIGVLISLRGELTRETFTALEDVIEAYQLQKTQRIYLDTTNVHKLDEVALARLDKFTRRINSDVCVVSRSDTFDRLRELIHVA